MLVCVNISYTQVPVMPGMPILLLVWPNLSMHASECVCVSKYVPNLSMHASVCM